MCRVAEVDAAEGLVRDPADREHPPPARELACEGQPRGDLCTRRAAVETLAAGVRRDDVPEQHIAVETELGEGAVDNGGGRLGRAQAGQLALRGERDPRHAGATVAGRLAHEQVAGARRLVQVALDPLAQQRRALAVPVEVVGRADPRGSEPLDEPSRHDPYSD